MDNLYNLNMPLTLLHVTSNFSIFVVLISYFVKGCCSRDHMVHIVEFITAYAINAYHH